MNLAISSIGTNVFICTFFFSCKKYDIIIISCYYFGDDTMHDILKKYLFDKCILVNDTNDNKDYKAVLLALANKLGIQIVEGEKKLNIDIFKYASKMMGENIPLPFYEGFPESVLKLTVDELQLDQLIHYIITYGQGDFSTPGHSLLEENIKRNAFSEFYQIKKFRVLSLDEAIEYLYSVMDDMASNSRPLTQAQYDVFLLMYEEYGYLPKNFKSKDILARLYLDTNKDIFIAYFELNDVLRILGYIQNDYYRKSELLPLNLKNCHRKIITNLIDKITERNSNIDYCYEKKKYWNILLHHIHYKPKNECGKELLKAMRGNENKSVYSIMENRINNGDVLGALDIVIKEKGNGEALRHLDYFFSRAEKNEIKEILNRINMKNPIILLQLYYHYNSYERKYRVFTYTRYNLLYSYKEHKDEYNKRKSFIKSPIRKILLKYIYDELKLILKDRVGKVYIDPEMKNIAFPIKEDISNIGYGVLPKGSRIKLNDNNVIRAFTYWELVNDIDLSVLGITNDGKIKEFSWRTMAFNQQKGIVFSGDQTSGYNGGSEYFDIDIKEFKKDNPNVLKLIFIDNVYSAITFKDIVCRAGYMERESISSGEIYEPKTIKTAFTINGDSFVVYLFAIDLVNNEFVWLNTNKNSFNIIAANEEFDFIEKIFKYRDIFSLYDFFNLCGSVVDNIEEADLIVSDSYDNNDKDIIHSYDIERILAILNE